MWVIKVKFNATKALLGGASKAFNISLLGYPLHVAEVNDAVDIFLAAIIDGDDINKKKFVNALKSHPRVLFVERNGDFLMAKIRDDTNNRGMYRSTIVNVEPIIIGSDGIEVWTLASASKKDLLNFVDIVEKNYNAELLSIVKKKVGSISIVNFHPDLTTKQKDSIKLASKNGYYDYPRKCNLNELAELSGLSYSTFQAHLRKAEKKLLPHFCTKLSDGLGNKGIKKSFIE